MKVVIYGQNVGGTKLIVALLGVACLSQYSKSMSLAKLVSQ